MHERLVLVCGASLDSMRTDQEPVVKPVGFVRALQRVSGSEAQIGGKSEVLSRRQPLWGKEKEDLGKRERERRRVQIR